MVKAEDSQPKVVRSNPWFPILLDGMEAKMAITLKKIKIAKRAHQKSIR